MGPEVTKVIFTYSDGTVKSISGESLKKWMDASISLAQLAMARQGRTGYEGVVWEPETKKIVIKPVVEK